MDSKRITIFTGNYGSGKTELAINYALKLKDKYKNVVLADLDIVNPYFRSREKRNHLEEKGIDVVYPQNLEQADLPIITADIYKIIQDKSNTGIFDVGGDEDGAVPLGSISQDLKDEEYEMNLVVNTIRPFTNDLEGITKMKENIEKTSRLSFDNLICNTNLGRETEIEHIKKGYKLIKKAECELGLPLKFIVIRDELLPLIGDFEPEEEIFPIKLYMNPPWINNL